MQLKMRGRLIQALIFLSSQSSESDKSYKKRMRQKGRKNVKPARPHQFYFLSGREQKYFSMTALPPEPDSQILYPQTSRLSVRKKA